jgi:hypothetical protein
VSRSTLFNFLERYDPDRVRRSKKISDGVMRILESSVISRNVTQSDVAPMILDALHGKCRPRRQDFNREPGSICQRRDPQTEATSHRFTIAHADLHTIDQIPLCPVARSSQLLQLDLGGQRKRNNAVFGCKKRLIPND